MPQYNPTYIGVGPQTTGFGVPEYNRDASKIGVATELDYSSAVKISGTQLDASLSPNRVRFFEDFFRASGGSLEPPLATQDTSSTGTPTIAFVDDALHGEFQLTHDNTSEAQNLTLYFGDQLVIDPTKNPIFEARLKINFAGATFTADQRFVCGLASARNATLDNIASNVWFRIEGANLNILVEGDDGTTDTNDVDSTYDIVDNTYLTLRIDMTSLSAVKFYVDGKLVPTTVSVSALTAANKLQPYIEIQRDAGAETESVVVDYLYFEQDRT